MAWAVPSAFLALAVVLLLLQGGHSIVFDLTAEYFDGGESDTVVLGGGFGMAGGGKMIVDAASSSPGAVMYVALVSTLEWEEWQARRSSYVDTAMECDFPGMARVAVRSNASGPITATVAYAGVYHLVLLRCAAPKAMALGTVTLLNPSNGAALQHIGTNYAAAPRYAMVLAIAYSLLLLWWVVSLGRYASQLVFPQALATAAIAAQTAAAVCDVLRWREFGSAGQLHTPLHYVSAVADLCSTTLLLASMTLGSVGFRVTRRTLSLRVWLSLCAIFAVYITTAALSGFCVPTANSDLCSAHELSEYILRSLVLLCVVVAMNFNISNIRAHILHSAWLPSMAVLYSKYSMFRDFRIAFLLYLVYPTVVLLLRISVITSSHEWLTDAMDATGLCVMYFLLGLSFRPRKMDPISPVIARVNQQ